MYMKRMILFFFYLGIILGQVNDAEAQRISLDDAKDIYEHFNNYSKKTYGKQDVLIDSIVDEEDETTIYLFSQKSDHFTIVAADKRVKPILAYSNMNDFNPQHLPSHVQDLLDFYAHTVSEIREASVSEVGVHPNWNNLRQESARTETKTSVMAFLNTKWDQGSGWNQFCPVDSSGPGNHVYAGCVAVAMAQAMKYYNHPDTGIGQKSMGTEYGILDVNFGGTEYQWSQMSDTQADEHNALLLYHCGVAVNMNYGPDGSGAYTRDVPAALERFYDYSPEMVFQNKYEDDQAWVDTLKSQLDKRHPIIYSGDNNADAGHAFNLDGYDDQDRFHINWGWSGAYNGYFSLTSLTPGGHNYSYGQGAVLNIKPFDHSPRDILLSSTKIMEKQDSGTVVGVVETVDPDEQESFTYSVENISSQFGEDVENFYIENDTLKSNKVFYYNQDKEKDIKISVEDSQGNTLEKEFTIKILELNYAPVKVSLSDTTLMENSQPGTLVGTLSTEDPDTSDSHTYTFVSDTTSDLDKHNNLFQIEDENELILAGRINYSLYNKLFIQLASTDDQGASVTQSFVIGIIEDTTEHTTGFFTSDKETVVSVYPNPVEEQLFVRIPEQYIGACLSIYTLTGKKIFDEFLDSTESQIPATLLHKNTLHILKIENNGKQVYSVKIKR